MLLLLKTATFLSSAAPTTMTLPLVLDEISHREDSSVSRESG